MKEVQMFKTKDGNLFENRIEAEAHEDDLNIKEYIDENPIMGLYPESKIDGAEFLNWLEENPRFYVKLLSKE